MTTLQVLVKSSAKIVRQGLEDLEDEVPKIGRNQIYHALKRARGRLVKPGKRVNYPIRWDSPRQKIKVIIMLKLADNLPYRRRGDYQKGFHIVKLDDGYQLDNDSTQAVYVGGDADGRHQSRIFRGRYPVIRETVDEEVGKIPSATVQHLITVAAKKGITIE